MAVDRSPVPVRNLYLPTDRFSNLRNTYLPRGQCSPSRNVSKNRACRKTEWTFSMIDSRARDRIDRLSAGHSLSPAIVLDLDGRQRRSAAASAWQSCRAEIAREKARSQTGHTYHMYVNLRTERVFMGRWNRCEWYSTSRRRQRAKRRENRITASGRNESSDSVTSATTNSVSLL